MSGRLNSIRSPRSFLSSWATLYGALGGPPRRSNSIGRRSNSRRGFLLPRGSWECTCFEGVLSLVGI